MKPKIENSKIIKGKYKRYEKTKINTTIVNDRSVTIHLDNGVSILISSNVDYVHIHFSGVDDQKNDDGECILVAGIAGVGGTRKMNFSNNIDIMYNPKEL